MNDSICDPLEGIVFHSAIEDLIQAEIWLIKDELGDSSKPFIPVSPVSLDPFTAEEERAVASGHFSGGGGSGHHNHHSNTNNGGSYSTNNIRTGGPSFEKKFSSSSFSSSLPKSSNLGGDFKVKAEDDYSKKDHQRIHHSDNEDTSNISAVKGAEGKNIEEEDDIPRLVHTLSDLDSDHDDHLHHDPHANLPSRRELQDRLSSSSSKFGAEDEETVSWAATSTAAALDLGSFDDRGNFVIGLPSRAASPSPLPVKVVSPPPLKEATAPVDTIDNNTLRWFYRDPSGNVQGPFGNQKMLDWYNRQYFPETLPLRRETGDLTFQTLGEWKLKCGGQVPFAPGALDKIEETSNVEISNNTSTSRSPNQHASMADTSAAMPTVLQNLFGMSLSAKTTSSPQSIRQQEDISSLSPRPNLKPSEPVNISGIEAKRSPLMADAPPPVSKHEFLAQLMTKKDSSSIGSPMQIQSQELSPSVQNFMTMASSINQKSATSAPAWGKIQAVTEPFLMEIEQEATSLPRPANTNRSRQPAEYRPLPLNEPILQQHQLPTWNKPLTAKQPPKSLIEIRAEEAQREIKERERIAREEQRSNPHGRSFAALVKQALPSGEPVVSISPPVKVPAVSKVSQTAAKFNSPRPVVQPSVVPLAPKVLTKEQLIRNALSDHLSLSQADEATCTSLLLETATAEETIAFIRDNLIASKPADGSSIGDCIVNFAKAVLQIAHGPAILNDRTVQIGLTEIERSARTAALLKGSIAGSSPTSSEWDTVSHGRRGGKGGKHR